MIGFAPDQVDAMSLFQFHATVHGWRKANGSAPKPSAPSDAEFEQAMKKVALRDMRHAH